MSTADFSLGRLSPHDQFEMWRKLLEPAFEPSLAGQTEIDRFDCDFSLGQVSDTVVMHGAASGQTFERSLRHVRQTGWDHVMVQLYTRGGFTGEANGRPVTVEAGDINVFDLSKTLHTTASDFANITLVLPRECFGDVGGLHGAVFGAGSGMTALIRSHIHGLADVGSNLTANESRAAIGALSMMIAEGSLKAGDRDTQAAACASLRDVVAAYVSDNIHDPALDVERILVACRMSRATLYRLFTADNGIARYVQNKRLDLALRLLIHQTDKRQRVGQVAYRCGFVNETHFSRVFRQRFGISPREAREIGGDVNLGDQYVAPIGWVDVMRRYRDEL